MECQKESELRGKKVRGDKKVNLRDKLHIYVTLQDLKEAEQENFSES
jgi:hypothetical protein